MMMMSVPASGAGGSGTGGSTHQPAGSGGVGSGAGGGRGTGGMPPSASGSGGTGTGGSSAAADAGTDAGAGGGDPGPVVTPVDLPDNMPGIGFDDLTYSPELKKLIVPAGRTGSVDLVDPKTLEVTVIDGFTASTMFTLGKHRNGSTSADYAANKIFAIDNESKTVRVIDLGDEHGHVDGDARRGSGLRALGRDHARALGDDAAEPRRDGDQPRDRSVDGAGRWSPDARGRHLVSRLPVPKPWSSTTKASSLTRTTASEVTPTPWI